MKKVIIVLTILCSNLQGFLFCQVTSSDRKELESIVTAYFQSSASSGEYDSLLLRLGGFIEAAHSQPHHTSGNWLYDYYQLGVRLFYESPQRTAETLNILCRKDWKTEHDSLTDRLARIHNLLGLAYKNSNNPEKSIDPFLTSMSLFEQTPDLPPTVLPSVYSNVANAYQNIGDYTQALAYFEEGSRQTEGSLRASEKDSPYTISLNRLLLTLKLNWAIVVGKMDEHLEAIGLYLEALRLAEEYDPAKKAIVLENIGISYLRTNDFPKASSSMNQSLELAKKNHDTTGILNNYVNLLSIYVLNDESQEFLDIVDEIRDIIIEYSTEGFFRNLLVTTYIQEAELWLKKGHYDLALERLMKGYAEIKKKPIPQKARDILTEPGFPYLSLDLMTLRSEALLARSRIEDNSEDSYKALTQLSIAEHLVDSLRSVLSSQESKIILNERQRAVYRSKADVCGLLFEQTRNPDYLAQLFTTMERGKSAGLWNEIQQRDLKAGYIPDSLLNQESWLRDELARVQSSLSGAQQTYGTAEAEIRDLETRKFELTTRLDRLIQIYNQDYPDYYALKFSNKTLALNELQQMLLHDAAFIQLFVTDNRIHQLVITCDTLVYRRLDQAEQLLDDASRVLEILKPRRYDFNRAAVREFSSLSNRLFRNLFEDVHPLLGDKSLIVSPDDRLNLLPFEVLVCQVDSSDKLSFAPLDFLIRHHTITYSNTATLWAYHQNREKKAGQKHPVLAFAPVYEARKNKMPYAALYGESLPELPGTIEETANIRNLFSSRSFVKEKATEGRFRKHADQAGMLHLAMHTIINDQEPLQSFLAFYPDEEGMEDGRLSGSEILNYRLHADLVVLSACHSGSGEVRKGEGILGLSRSFIQAGAPSLLLNLWIMDDRQGQHIISAFYQYLSQGCTVSAALRAAKLDHLEQAKNLQTHPHYWAGLVVHGQDAALDLPLKNTNNWLYTLLIVPLLSLIWLVWKKNRTSGRRS